jgi:hypothetical protein
VLQINVNGMAQPRPAGPENWGELLNLLERGDGAGRQVVTAVRFGGVAVPTFREPGALARGLRELGPIDVVTATVDDLLRESAQAAYDSIGPLGRAVRRIATKLRAGHERAATRDLPELTSALQTLTTVTAVLVSAPCAAAPHKADLDSLVVRLCRLVDGIIEHQVAADWRAVADLLDQDVAPTLDAWTSVTRRVWKIA